MDTRLPPGTLAPHSHEPAGKGVTVLFGVIDPDSPEEIGPQACSGGREEYVWNAGLPWGTSGLPRAVIKFSGKLDSPTQAGLLTAEVLQEEGARQEREPEQPGGWLRAHGRRGRQ